MEAITTNLTGTGKRVKVHGRDYLVAPVTLLVPGVLAGSKGPLLYPEDEVANSVDWWNGIPVVLNHPTINGEPVTARRPDVLEKYKLGRVYNVWFDGKLRGEGWFDAEATRRVDSRLWEALERGAQVEVSTGLYTRNDPAPEGSVHNGTPYTHTAGNYRPDHLAVLPDSIGACSIRQGCGVHNEQHATQDTSVTDTTTSVKEPPMFDRAASITFLTTNCDCWKAPEDKAILDGMSDAALTKLEANAKKPTPAPAPAVVPPVANTAPAPAVVTPPTTTLPVAPVVKELTMEEFRRLMPADAKAVWNSAEEIVEREKVALIQRITVNVTDQAQKVQLTTALSGESVPKLRLLAAAVPAPPQQDYLPVANYGLQSPLGYPQISDNFDENDVLGLPTINWAEEAKANSQTSGG